MKTIKLVSLILVLAVFLSAFAGCNSTPNEETGEQETTAPAELAVTTEEASTEAEFSSWSM